MKITIAFKHLPAGGKFIRNNKYYVSYNTKGNYNKPGNKHKVYRLPKFIWRMI